MDNILVKKKSKKTARTFKDLIVWQRAHEFVLITYQFTRRFPSDETEGLIVQFRRASIAIATSIAQAFRKTGPNERMRLLNHAIGSLEECKYYLVLCEDLNYGYNEDLAHLSQEIDVLLDDFRKSMHTRSLAL